MFISWLINQPLAELEKPVIGVIILLALVAVAATIPLAMRRRKERRRERLRAQPFPDAWKEILNRNFSLYRFLPDRLKNELHGHIRVFLAEKNFEGAGGLEMTDEIRVTIAAQACALLLNRPTDYYPQLQSIIVYPTSFEVEDPVEFSDNQYLEDTEVRVGESWHSGAVVIAWDQALNTGRDLNDGQNVIFHEFAHQLDEENESSDGIPQLPRIAGYLPWARVLGKEFKKLRRSADTGTRTLLDHYGATNEAEFFAVATECFFEKPAQMKKLHPELYEQMKLFYNQDPAAYLNSRETA